MASVQWKRVCFPFYFLVAQIAAQTSDPCGALPLASRFAFQSSYTPGVSVEYQCVSGYVQQSGDAQLTCNGTQWQGELLQCRSEHHGNTSHAKRCWQYTLARTVVWWWRLLYRVPKQEFWLVSGCHSLAVLDPGKPGHCPGELCLLLTTETWVWHSGSTAHVTCPGNLAALKTATGTVTDIQ